MFFLDLEGGEGEAPITAAIGALREKAENVRVLESYPRESVGIPGA
jgi:prephenate dehydratase